MHPESQSLEASFEPAGTRTGAPRAAAADPAVQEFSQFFEKLSALDSLQWSAEPGTAPRNTVPPHSVPSNAKRAHRKPGKPRMTVLKSDEVLQPPPPAVGAVAASIEPVATDTGEARGRIAARDVARFLRLTLVGLVLFALGLAAGYAALSMPGRFDHGVPTFSDLMERTRAIALPRSETPAGFRTASADPLRVVETSRAGTTPASGATPPQGAARGEPVATRTAQAPATAAADTSEPETGFVMPTPGTVNMATAPTEPAASPASAPQPAPARPAVARAAPPHAALAHAAPAHAAPAQSPATGPEGPRFTLQVGACSSYACVENYRKLLLTRVGSQSIKVVTQPVGEAGATIQRIRVQPLERIEAERLKAELASADPRFNDAYLIALH